MTYFKKKNIHLIEGSFIKFWDPIPQIKKKPLKIKKNTFSKKVQEIKIPQALSTLKITVP
jgi:hypothetical protein